MFISSLDVSSLVARFLVLTKEKWSLCVPFSFSQYVVIPTRRATAEAFQILVSHALGDAGSPYLIGQVSEILKVS